MNRLFAALSYLVLIVGVAASPAAANAQVAIRVSQQPQRWALEWYIASQKGWWKQVGLEATMSTFASGAPQVAAGASGSWDLGGAGDIPAVLGAARYGLLTIAIADEEAAIITIMATKEKADQYAKNPTLIKGKVIPVTTNSTGQWGAAACLEQKFGLKPSEYKFVNLSPPEINAAVTSGRYDISEVWAPNTYILEFDDRGESHLQRPRRRASHHQQLVRGAGLRQGASGYRRQISRGLSALDRLGTRAPNGGGPVSRRVLQIRRRQYSGKVSSPGTA